MHSAEGEDDKRELLKRGKTIFKFAGKTRVVCKLCRIKKQINPHRFWIFLSCLAQSFPSWNPLIDWRLWKVEFYGAVFSEIKWLKRLKCWWKKEKIRENCCHKKLNSVVHTQIMSSLINIVWRAGLRRHCGLEFSQKSKIYYFKKHECIFLPARPSASESATKWKYGFLW